MVLLLNRHMSFCSVDQEEETALHYAVKFPNLNIIKLLMLENTQINKSNKFGFTALHLAILNEQTEIVKYLIDSGADVNLETKGKDVPLHLAVIRGSVEIIKMLLANGAIVNKKTKSGITPLHRAVSKRKKEIVELLIHAKADVNAVGDRDETPLNIAVEYGYEDIAKFFISHGAVVNHCARANVCKNRHMLLHMSVFNKNINLVKLLLEHDADVTVVIKNDRTALHIAAAQRGSSEIVKMLLMKGADVNAKTYDGFTALHISVAYNDLEICKVLLQNKANIDIEDNKGRTPLCFAAEHGYVEMLVQILSFKPDLSKNKLVLYYAVKGNDVSHKKIISELIAHEYSMDLLNNWSEFYVDTFMANAVTKGYTEIVEYLLKNGYNVNKPLPREVEDIKFGSLLHLAIRKGQLQNAQLLIEFGSDVNVVDESGQKPIFYAVEKNSYEMTKLLLDNKATVNESHELLFMVARKYNSRLMKEILNHYKNVNVEDEFGKTVLHWATWHGDEEIVQLLFEKGTKCKSIDQSRQVCFNSKLYTYEDIQKELTTPLHVAARANWSNVAEAILESGLSIDCRDDHGRTPLHIAIELDKYEIIDLFMEFDANLYAKDHAGYTCIDNIYTLKDWKVTKQLMMKYLAVAHVRNQNSFIQPVSCDKSLERYYDHCINELALLRSIKILNNITLCDILTKSIDTLTSYLRNSKFIKLFESLMNAEKYPFYKNILKNRMRRAKDRRLLLDGAKVYFTNVLCLPDPPTNKIMNLLSARDLGSIKQTYESFYSQLCYSVMK